MLSPESWGESLGGGTLKTDGLWTPVLVVATVNQGDKVVVLQGNQSSQGVGHVVVPKLEAQTRH